jgi:L-iditol 2-dehydrogenase
MTAPQTVVQAARIHGPGDVRVAAEPAAEPGPGEVLLRVTGVGLCGSDLHWWEEGSIGDARLSRPLILGHEFGGVIVSGPRAGQRVAADPANDCGECEPCREGRTNLCLAMRFAGHGTTDGALRSLMPWPERLLVAIPDSIGDDEAPLLEPLGVALHAMDLAGVGVNPGPPGPAPAAGLWVGVYGCGPIGLLLVQLLRRAGATVVATDLLPHRVAAAGAMGASEAFLVDGGPEPESSSARQAAREREVDVAFEVSGSDAALADAIAAVRPGGRLVLVGIPAHDRTSFEAAAARRKELALLLCRRMVPTDLPHAVAIAAGGGVQLTELISHRYEISRAPEAFEMLGTRGGLKVVVKPDAE